LLVPGEGIVLAQPKTETATAPAATATAAPDTTAAKPIPPEQLESLVAPIALYPDDLLAQTLVASTYPLELVQLQQFMAKHPNLKDQALADSVAMQPWDPSIQSMAAVPEVVKRLADDIQWTTDLGNAFLAQQGDVMDAVQRMRKKAKDNGALESNEQQKVETKVVEQKTVIIVQPTNPEVIYVPSYSPTVVYGAPMYYPYPPIYYPYYPPGAAFVSFGIGMMWGAAMWGGSCCGCGWGGNNVNINVNNNFNRVDHHGGDRGRGDGNRGGGNRGDGGRGGAGGGPSASTRPAGGGGGNWQHNPEHRGGTPYGDRGTASKYGGSARGDSRPSASQQPARGGAGNRGGAGAGASTRPAGGAGAGASTRPAGGAGSAGISDRSAGGAGSRSGSDNIGSRNIPKSSSSSSRSNNGFSGGSRGYSGSSARSSSSRGSSSMGSRGGGGRSGGGGGRGGGGRR
jgi:hypothetical protein